MRSSSCRLQPLSEHFCWLWHELLTTCQEPVECCMALRCRLLTCYCNALQALDAAKAAVTGWEAASVASRRGALDAAKVAAEFSQLCHKFMRSVHRS